MFPGLSRDARQPTVVSLELKPTAITVGRAELVDAGQRHRKPRNRSFSPVRVDITAARSDTGRFKTGSNKSVLAGDSTTALLDGLPPDSSRHHPKANQATATNRKAAVERLPQLTNADNSCLVAAVTNETSPRKWDGSARPFEVCALQLNPDIRSMPTRAQFHQQQQSTVGVANGNDKTTNSVSLSSDTGDRRSNAALTKLDVRLPLSDDNEDDLKLMECRHGKTSTGRRVRCGTTAVTEDSCAVLSVRIEFCKSHRNHVTDTDADSTATSGQSDSGGGRRQAGRTQSKTKHFKTTSKPTSPSKSICVAGRGKVVVIDDGIYDQFARRHPPKYVTNRTFDTTFNRANFDKW